jgi:hypothetical protein
VIVNDVVVVVCISGLFLNCISVRDNHIFKIIVVGTCKIYNIYIYIYIYIPYEGRYRRRYIFT